MLKRSKISVHTFPVELPAVAAAPELLSSRAESLGPRVYKDLGSMSLGPEPPLI